MSAESNPWVIEHRTALRRSTSLRFEECLDTCRERLPKAVKAVRGELSPAVMSKVRNLTDQNLHGLEIDVNVEGDGSGCRGSARFSGLAKRTRGGPRIWGPWTGDEELQPRR